MCGIAGIFNREKPVDIEQLNQVSAELQHRGPDAVGFYHDGHIGMTHTRLSINDLSGGNQPLFSSDRNLVLVANGEIYNHLELREHLEARGYQYQTHSDCESILYAYQEWGDEFVEHLYGMFAFALLDIKNQSLLLVRDRLGIKPLFYIQDGEGIRFASELKALLLSAEEREAINPDAVIELLNNNFTSGRSTLVRNVERVMPGECLYVIEGVINRRQRYWSLLGVGQLQLSQQKAEQRFEELMAEVIPQHLRSDVPLGIFLSGGVDSSVLLSLLRRYTDQSISSFSVGFPDSDTHNELSAARRMADMFETDHHELEMDREQLLGVLPQTIWAADELMGDYANLPVWLLSEFAASKVKVVFSGEGGDEVFAGYGRYRKNSFQKVMNLLSLSSRAGFRKRGMLKGKWVSGIWGQDLKKRSRDWDQIFDEYWEKAPSHWTDLQRMQYVDISTWLCDDLLVKADRMMMAHGVEGRVPFLDHRIVEFGMSLPDELKVEKRSGKRFLKKWAENYLPVDHLYARKKGFTVPVRQWMADPALLQRLSDGLSGSRRIRDYFSPEGLSDLLEYSRKNRKNSSALWMLLQLLLWLDGIEDNWQRDGKMDARMKHFL